MGSPEGAERPVDPYALLLPVFSAAMEPLPKERSDAAHRLSGHLHVATTMEPLPKERSDSLQL